MGLAGLKLPEMPAISPKLLLRLLKGETKLNKPETKPLKGETRPHKPETTSHKVETKV